MKNLDQKISKMIYNRAHASPILTWLAKFGATYAIGLMVVVAVLFVWMNPIMTIVSLFGTILFSWIVTLVLQFLIRRKRPFECLIYESKVKLFCKTPSFPSAHATIAFTIVWNMYLNEMMNVDYIFLLFLVVAIWISISRVAVGVHYVSDIVVGAFLGIMIPILSLIFALYYLPH